MRFVKEGEFQGRPRELIDLGDQLVLVGEAVGRGEASGVPVPETYALLVSFENRRVIRERYYADAGLPEGER